MRLNLLNVLLAYAMNTKLSGTPCDSADELLDSVGRTRAECGPEIFWAEIGFSAFSISIFRKAPGVLEALLSALRTVARINLDAEE